MIALNALTKSYAKKTVVEPLTLHIGRGDLVGVVGPNGAGKSTLMQMIATVLKPSAGTIAIDGKDSVKQVKAVRRRIGYVPQDLALYTDLSVRDNLSFWAKMAGADVSRARIAQITDIVGLTQQVTTKVSRLSGGMQRKLNIAVALLHDPDILIMDEPTVGIDIQSKQDIVTFIKKLGTRGKTILYSSHDAQEIEQLSNKLLIMNSGKLQYYGTVVRAYDTVRDHGSSDLDVPSFPQLLARLGQWTSET